MTEVGASSSTEVEVVMSRIFTVARRLPKTLESLLVEYGVTAGLVLAVYYVAMAIRTH